MTECIVVKDVFKDYELGNTIVHVLGGINLTINKGELVAVVGPSGSGKTTLLNILGCLDTPSLGEVIIDDIVVNNLTSNKTAEFRAKKIGFIFQKFNLISVLTAFENIEFPLLGNQLNRMQRKKRVLKLLDAVGLKDYASRKPNDLSGGQQQRVAIARALAAEPTIVLADELTGNLDSSTAKDIMSLIHSINEEQVTTFVIATHDVSVLKYVNRIVKLRDGKIEQEMNN